MSKVVVNAKTAQDFYHQNKPDTDYFYKQMNIEEKIFFDQLKNQSEAFLWGYQEPYKFKFSDGSDGYCYGNFDLGLLDAKRAGEIADLFYFSCPQYFFSPGKLLRVNGKYCLMVREDYCTREIIDSYRDQINAKTKSWLEELAKYDDDLKLEKAIIKIIHDNTEYGKNPRYDKDGYQVYDQYGEFVYNSNNQEIVGTVADGKAVCNGYAKIMQYLCNYAGLECLYMQSTETGNHAFNMIKLNGDWYCIDVTEPSGNVSSSSEPLLNESYETFQKSMGKSHVINERIAAYGMSLPKCDRNLFSGVLKEEVIMGMVLIITAMIDFAMKQRKKNRQMKMASDTKSESTIELSEKAILRQINMRVPDYFFTKPYANIFYIWNWSYLVIGGIIFIWAFKSAHNIYLRLLIQDDAWNVNGVSLMALCCIVYISFYKILKYLYNLVKIYISEPRRFKKLYSKINLQEECIFYTFYDDCLYYKSPNTHMIIRYQDLISYTEDSDKLVLYYKPAGGFTLDKKQCNAEEINFVKALIPKEQEQPRSDSKKQSDVSGLKNLLWSCIVAVIIIICGLVFGV